MNSSTLSLLRGAAATLLLSALPAIAAPDASQLCNLRVASGPTGKVYEQIVRDMRAACGHVASLCTLNTQGGLPNLQMLSANEAELGLVQIDLLTKLKESDVNVATLKAVMPLHANLLHAITLAAGSKVDVWTLPWIGSKVPFTGDKVVFTKYSQLRGRTVALVGSAQLTAQMLEEHKRLDLVFVPVDSDELALKLLRGGDVQAVLTLAGWPMPILAREGGGSDLRLADFDVAASKPYQVVKRNYQNLGVLNLGMLAVPNLLMARPFNASGRQGQWVSALQACLVRQLDELKDGRYQAAWKEIGDPADTQGWPRWESGTLAPRKLASK
jgi:hypothetical protein